jgi:GAF domain-containing protein
MLTKRPARVEDPASQLRVSPIDLGVSEVRTGLLVPLVYRGEALGVMAAFDRDAGTPEFDEDDEQVLVVFAASAAAAVGQDRGAQQS